MKGTFTLMMLLFAVTVRATGQTEQHSNTSISEENQDGSTTCRSNEFTLEDEWSGDDRGIVYTDSEQMLEYKISMSSPTLCLDVPSISHTSDPPRRGISRYQFRCSRVGYGKKATYKFKQVQKMWVAGKNDCDGNIVRAHTKSGNPIEFKKRQSKKTRDQL